MKNASSAVTLHVNINVVMLMEYADYLWMTRRGPHRPILKIRSLKMFDKCPQCTYLSGRQLWWIVQSLTRSVSSSKHKREIIYLEVELEASLQYLIDNERLSALLRNYRAFCSELLSALPIQPWMFLLVFAREEKTARLPSATKNTPVYLFELRARKSSSVKKIWAMRCTARPYHLAIRDIGLVQHLSCPK